ncbi:MAG: transglutaminase domain-containing protein [Clostridiales bacterium]|nr:transglutaminase domain-containing protein [Clostridiales bacterium]
MENKYLKKTPMVNYDAAPIQNLIESRGWKDLDTYNRIGAIYDYVRNEILFGYNRSDTLTAEEVLADGYGQCNTKATLLMALFRGCGIPCRLHGSEVSKCFQRGATSGIISILAPKTIAHTWVEVFYDGKWIALEGVITDDAYVQGVKKKENPEKGPFQKYAISVPDLTELDLTWRGQDLFVQNASMVKDFGTFDDPDTFFTLHKQTWSKVKDFAYVHYGRKVMNRNVARMRKV